MGQPPAGHQRLLKQAASALRRAVGELPWTRLQVRFEAGAGDVVAVTEMEAVFEDGFVAVQAAIDEAEVASVGDVMTRLRAESGPQPWSAGELEIVRDRDGYQASVHLSEPS
jgi:hypothetical protein